MRKVAVWLSVLVGLGLTACASGGKQKGLLETYYTTPQKVVYTPVVPPYMPTKYPIRFGEEVMRVWVAPRDSGMIFVDGHYMYIVVTRSRWYPSPVKPPEYDQK